MTENHATDVTKKSINPVREGKTLLQLYYIKT